MDKKFVRTALAVVLGIAMAGAVVMFALSAYKKKEETV